MAKLTDYLDVETLRQLAAMFSVAAEAPVQILGPDGEILAGETDGAPAARVDVLVGPERTCSVALLGRPPEAQTVRLLGLMRDVLARLCEQANQLRDRVEELAAMYRLTEAFTGRVDLKEVHRIVAETMVSVTGTDACSIRVVSDDRTELLTMAAYGLSSEYMAKGRILLDDSQIDREVISTGAPVTIADQRTDPRVLYKAPAQREGIVSALCVPMTYRGRVEGVIRVYTKRPHTFDWFETSLIRGVAAQAASAIVNARLYTEALAGETMRRQLRMAAEVQRRMIPANPPQLRGFDIASVYVPCFELGGDFYDFIDLPGGNVGLAIADVMGKGVRASLLMASARSALRAHAAHIYELSLVLAAVNVHMWRESQEGDFLTMFYGVLDVPKRRLTYCNAGHEPPLLIRGGEAHPLPSAGGGVLGLDPLMQFTHEVLDLHSGDVLVMSTDGLPEALDFRDEPFGRDRVRDATLAAVKRGDSAEGIGKHLLWEMRRFSGLQSRGDDLTLVVLKVQ